MRTGRSKQTSKPSVFVPFAFVRPNGPDSLTELLGVAQDHRGALTRHGRNQVVAAARLNRLTGRVVAPAMDIVREITRSGGSSPVRISGYSFQNSGGPDPLLNFRDGQGRVETGPMPLPASSPRHSPATACNASTVRIRRPLSVASGQVENLTATRPASGAT